ncbi:POTRA domain-containing protein [Mesorhizobium atlanticum]
MTRTSCAPTRKPLRRFYYNHGYADFQAVSAVGELDDATNKYTVTITVQEGDRYTFGDVSVESTIPEVDLEGAAIGRRNPQGRRLQRQERRGLDRRLDREGRGLGLCLRPVTPRGDRNFENHTISVVYTIDQGTKAYVERIEIRGNDRTRDYVIRREFDVSEGDAFNQYAHPAREEAAGKP